MHIKDQFVSNCTMEYVKCIKCDFQVYTKSYKMDWIWTLLFGLSAIASYIGIQLRKLVIIVIQKPFHKISFNPEGFIIKSVFVACFYDDILQAGICL